MCIRDRTNVVTGKRYIKKLVEEGIVDGWDDPRLVSIAALKRRGFTPESIKMFVELCGISKSQSSVDYAMLEYCIREDLKLKLSLIHIYPLGPALPEMRPNRRRYHG